MIREQGVVVQVKDGLARVAVDAARHTQCRACGICRAAGDGKQMLMDVPSPEGLEIGDKVTVDIPVPGPGRSAALLLLVPLVLFMAAMLLAVQLQDQGWLPEGSVVSVLVALAAMGIWYVLVALYDRHLRRALEHQPRIVKR